jgi:hypothetical protein
LEAGHLQVVTNLQTAVRVAPHLARGVPAQVAAYSDRRRPGIDFEQWPRSFEAVMGRPNQSFA